MAIVKMFNPIDQICVATSRKIFRVRDGFDTADPNQVDELLREELEDLLGGMARHRRRVSTLEFPDKPEEKKPLLSGKK